VLLVATTEKFDSLDVANAGGRGHGEPIPDFVDRPVRDRVDVRHEGERKFLIASSEGQRLRRQMKRTRPADPARASRLAQFTIPVEACAITTLAATQVAVIGSNHNYVIFPLDQVPRWLSGVGVRLQKYTSVDIVRHHYLRFQGGLAWKDFRRSRPGLSWKELADCSARPTPAARLTPAEFEQVRAEG